jgi:hypothetical protein
VRDVVKAVRQSPFGEWVIAFYDPAKTAPDKLLERLRKNGCEKAERVEPKAVEGGGLKVRASNPVAVPGDFFEIAIEGAKAAPETTAPKGWSVAVKGAKRVLVQSPKDAKPGKHKIAVGGLDVEVELVTRVR